MNSKDLQTLRNAGGLAEAAADEIERLSDIVRRSFVVPSPFLPDDFVEKVKGAHWSGYVRGVYSTPLTPEGICVESDRHRNTVQIYPAAALKKVTL